MTYDRNTKLPTSLETRLKAFCAVRGENPEHVLADALVLHLDILEQTESDELLASYLDAPPASAGGA